MASVLGINKVMANLNKEIKNIKGATLKGLINASITIRRLTESEMPVTPLKYGNLRASWYTTTAKMNVAKGANPTWKGPVRLHEKLSEDHAKAVEEGISYAKSATRMGMIALVMGYSANYALIVHQKTDPNVKWSRKGSGPLWLEKAIKNNKRLILQDIKDNIKI